MIRSMTGFGRMEGVAAGKRILVEMKSLNHRYLEISLRMPAALAVLEMEIKKRIGERYTRGKFEVSVRLENGGGSEAPPALNLPLARQYHSLLTQLRRELGIPGR